MLFVIRSVTYSRLLFSARGSFLTVIARGGQTEKLFLHVSAVKFKMDNAMIKSELDTKEYR